MQSGHSSTLSDVAHDRDSDVRDFGLIHGAVVVSDVDVDDTSLNSEPSPNMSPHTHTTHATHATHATAKLKTETVSNLGSTSTHVGSHDQAHQARDDRPDDLLGGNPTKELDHRGVGPPPGRAASGERHVTFGPEETEDTPPAAGASVEPSFQEESLPGDLRSGADGHPGEWQRDYANTAKAVHDAPSSGEDPVGFGKHASLSYQEVAQQQPSYAQWVITMTQEDADKEQCDQRLLRLGHWLVQHPRLMTPAGKTTPSDLKDPKISKGYSPKTKKDVTAPSKTFTESAGSSISQQAANQQIQQLASMMAELKEELSNLKEERPRKETKTAEGCRNVRLLPAVSAEPVSHLAHAAAVQELGAVDSPCDHTESADDDRVTHQDNHGWLDDDGLPHDMPMLAMSAPEQQHLVDSVDALVPSALGTLVAHGPTNLLEVACNPDSVLSTTMHHLTGDTNTAVRCSIWNGCDLTTGAGVRSVLNKIDLHRPKHVWVSPICGPYSVMQNINQRTEEQKASLEAKRKSALKQYVACGIIFRYCHQRGIDVTWEWSQSCQAWRLPLIQKLMVDCQPHFAVIRGCQVNLRDAKQRFISKGWKIMTTNELMAEWLDLPCRCSPGTIHVPCEGSLTSRTAYYTKEFAKRVCRCILKGVDGSRLQQELFMGYQGDSLFGLGTSCSCSHGQQHGANLTCGSCTQADDHDPKQHPVDSEGLVADNQDQGMSLQEIRKKLYLLHAATGHGPVKHLVLALKRRGASPRVIQEAERFTCSVCQERSMPRPRHQSSLEPQPRRFEVISADVGHWVHPTSGEHHQFLLVIDEGSRFRVTRHVLSGNKKHISASQFISTLRESWFSYFGNPHTLRVDPDGAFRSHELSAYCDQQHIYLDIVPGEAHWKIGSCERGVQAIKDLVTKLAADQPDESFQDLLSEATRVFNSRELVRGFSPIQHVMGRAPDETGRFFPAARHWSDDLQCEGARQDNEKSHQLRLQAEKAYLDWSCAQRLSRAAHSRAQRKLNFRPGDLVYIWHREISRCRRRSQTRQLSLACQRPKTAQEQR